MTSTAPFLKTSYASLAGALVRISRECESPVELLRAEQLVREASAAWPGEEAELWSKWLTEACHSLNLRASEVTLPVDQASRLAEDGAAVVGLWRPNHGAIVLTGRGEIAEGEIDATRSVTASELQQAVAASPTPDLWLVVERADSLGAGGSEKIAARPILRLAKILRAEWSDIWLILVFAVFSGVLSLSTPIAVESLVNTVAFGRLLQPVFVLAAMLFFFLAFAAIMQAMQTYVAEVIQRRLFARVSADLAHRLPYVASDKVGDAYLPELTNRFLDVVTLQKTVATLLLDGLNIVLVTLVGMTVLAFYHPWLLGFDVLLLGLIIAGLAVLGRGAIRTGIVESKYKYRLTSWLEDLARCPIAFKSAGGAEFAADRANLITTSYLRQRRSHFAILFRQILFILALQAVAGTILLGGGGLLVVQGQLSLGQLVAAELIVSVILASMAKLGKHLEGFYDLSAAVDKLGVLFDLPVERSDGLMGVHPSGSGVAVAFKGVKVAGSRGRAGSGLSVDIPAGGRVALLGPGNSGKSALCAMLYGVDRPDAGRVTIEGYTPSDLRPDVLRGIVALSGEAEVFEGTISENVHLRRRDVSSIECVAALEAVGLLEVCLSMPQGLDTPLTAAARPLSSSQQRLLTLARAIAGRPELLLIDGALDSLPDEDLQAVLDGILSNERRWTVIVATGRRDIAERMESVVELTEPALTRSAAGVTGEEA